MNTLLLIIIAFSSLISQWIAWKIRLPAILFLLLSGILLGPVGHIINPDKLFGELLFPVISLSVAIILFEGALTLRLSEIDGLGGVVRNLVTVGMLVTFSIITFASWLILNVSPEIAALIGAVTVVTGPTVIAPLMRVVRPNASVNQVLRWEGIVIDPVGAIFTLLVFEFITLHGKSDTLLHLALTLGETVFVGFFVGITASLLLGNALKRQWLPAYLQNFAVLAIILMAFGISNHIAEESGLLAVTVMGIWLANMRGLDISGILAFKEEISAILLSGLFIILAARLDLSALTEMGLPLIFLLFVVQFIARPLCIAISTVNSSLSLKEKLLLCWIAPRGIVAAAVSSLFAMTLLDKGYEDANQLVTVVFAIIIGTVVLQGLTSRSVARLLGVRKKQPQTVLIVGANSVARELAHVLTKLNIPVLLTDDNRDDFRIAKLEGLDIYYGNAWSEHAENYLDLSDIALVVTLFPDNHKNDLAAYHFIHIFGEKRVLTFSNISESENPAGKQERFRKNKSPLYAGVSWDKLSNFLGGEGVFKATRLNDHFGWVDYIEKNSQIVPLFTIDDSGKLCTVESVSSVPLPCTLIAAVKAHTHDGVHTKESGRDRHAGVN